MQERGGRKLKLIVFCLALVTVGCATAPIIDFASPASISVRRDPVLVSGPEAGRVAQDHCQKYGKDAEITSRGMEGNWAVMTFSCK